MLRHRPVRWLTASPDCGRYMIMFAVAALVSVVCMATKVKLFYDKYRARNRSGNGGSDALSIAARRRALKDRVDGNKLDQHRMYPPL